MGMAVQKLLKNFLIGFVLFWPSEASAHIACSDSIGVVNIEKITAESEVFVEAEKTLSRKRKDFETELRKQERKMAKREEGLRGLKKKDPGKFEKEQKRFEKQLQKLYEKLEDRKNLLKEAYAKEMGGANEKMQEAFKAVAKKKKLCLILNKNTLPYSNDQLDFTEETMGEMKKIKEK